MPMNKKGYILIARTMPGARAVSIPNVCARQRFVTRARADHWFQANPGSLVQTPDGRVWTIVYNNLDGYGVIEGDHPDLVSVDDDALPAPTHMLRESYATASLPCIGEMVRLLRRVFPDGTARQNLSLEEAGAP